MDRLAQCAPTAAAGTPPCVPADADVVRRILAGHREDFSIVVHRHAAAVFAVALRIVRDHDAADDVAQETFVRAWTRLPEWDSARPMRPWLLRIAANLALDRTRSQARVVSMHDEPASPRTPRADAAAAELRAQLDAAMQQLSPEARAVVAMKYDGDLSIEEIARATGRRPGAVKVALHRARLRLREIVFGSEDQP